MEEDGVNAIQIHTFPPDVSMSREFTSSWQQTFASGEDLMRTPLEIIESSGSGPEREELLRTEHGRGVLKSWLASRLAVGVLGLLMPILLITGDKLVLAYSPSTRGSLSAYYHSGMRDIFVGTLCVIGLFLITYRINENDLDNWLTVIAGLAAVGVALFPTWTDHDQPLTPWQEKLTEPTAATIHGVAAAVFILSLAVMSFRFAHRDGRRGHARFALAHRICGGVMVAAVVAFAVLKLGGVDELGGFSVLLVVEVACTVAFGISWLLKGIDLAAAIRDAKAGQAPAIPVTVP
jgi:hypothetical protein